MLTNEYLKRVYDGLAQRNANEPEFLQAVREVLELSLIHISSRALVMLLPTPPLPETTPMTFFTLLLGLGASCSGAAVREEHAAPQVEQSWVHSSLIL